MPKIEPMLASATEREHALLEQRDGVQRLGEEHPLLHVGERDRRSPACGEVLAQARPEPRVCRPSS